MTPKTLYCMINELAVMACSAKVSKEGQSVGQLKVCMSKTRGNIIDKSISLLHYLERFDLYCKCVSATECEPDELLPYLVAMSYYKRLKRVA